MGIEIAENNNWVPSPLPVLVEAPGRLAEVVGYLTGTRLGLIERVRHQSDKIGVDQVIVMIDEALRVAKEGVSGPGSKAL